MNQSFIYLSLFLGFLVLAEQIGSTKLSTRGKLVKRDPFEVREYASLGESFASGVGAGDPYDNPNNCRRFTQAFGPQVASATQIRGPKPIKFDFLACAGARARHIYQQSAGPKKPIQAPLLKGLNPDMVTMSIGGNDIGFFKLLDRCVYRFYDTTPCAGCLLSSSFDDCSNDCQKAIDKVNDAIVSKIDFILPMKNAINAIFDNAPDTKLFVTGYPRFWNDQTDACDRVSFKTFCLFNRVLPLIKERRRKMNELTLKLNQQLRNIVASLDEPRRSSTFFVDTDPFFEGHRFCEEGVSEPSYRNPNIWFYPFEYTVGETPVFDPKAVPSGDCQAIFDDGGDQGDYYACEIANAVLAGGTVDFGSLPNNVNGTEDLGVTIRWNDSNVPVFLGRIFHPTINGGAAYKDAIVSAYRNSPSQATATPAPATLVPATPVPAAQPIPPKYKPGVCSFHLKETVTCEDDSQNLYASIKLFDNDKNVIGSTGTENGGKGPGINAASPFALNSQLPLTLLVTGQHQGDFVQFSYGPVSWPSSKKDGDGQCRVGNWDPNLDYCVQGKGRDRSREMDCSFPCT